MLLVGTHLIIKIGHINRHDMSKLMGGESAVVGPRETSGQETMGETTITVDQIVELLNSPRRRHLISCMAGLADAEEEFAELIKCVTEAECGEEWTEQERKRVQISLHQNHVPTLERDGIVVHREAEDGTRYVAKGPQFDVVARAYKELNEVAANEDERGGLLDRLL